MIFYIVSEPKLFRHYIYFSGVASLFAMLVAFFSMYESGFYIASKLRFYSNGYIETIPGLIVR